MSKRDKRLEELFLCSLCRKKIQVCYGCGRCLRHCVHRDDQRWWLVASQSSLDPIWDNITDDCYTPDKKTDTNAAL